MCNFKFYIPLTIIILTVLTACGYRLGTGGTVPGGIQRIHISSMDNPTRDPGLETLFTNALIDEFIRKTDVIISNQEQADAVLAGKITSLQTRIASRQALRSIRERRITGTISLELINQKDGSLIWSAEKISAAQTYRVTEDVLDDEYLRSQALVELSTRIAERAVERLMFAPPDLSVVK